MPNVIFKPRPMVDPYAGKAGELIKELFQTIGQIHQLRQQRNQTNAILDIIKNPNLNEEQKRMGMLDVARNGGDVLRNMMARQYVADALVPEHEKKLRAQRLETERARAEYWKSGAAGRASGLKTYKDYQNIYNTAAKQRNELRAISKVNKTDEDPKVVEQLESQMEYGQRGMAGLSPSGEMPPRISPKIQIISDAFSNWPDTLTADRKAQEELIKQGYAKDNNEASSMVLDLVEKLPALKNKTTMTNQHPSVFNQPKTQIAKAKPTAGGEMVGPPAPPGYVKRDWTPEGFVHGILQPGSFVKAPTPVSPPQAGPPQIATRAELMNNVPKPESKEEFDKLPSGTVYYAPDGTLRKKP